MALHFDPRTYVRDEDKPLTPFGRRVLVRFALLSEDGQTSVSDLSRKMRVHKKTLWWLLKETEPVWWTKAHNIEVAVKLCAFLKVDFSWLYDEIEYGDMGALEFTLQRRKVWR